MSPARLEALFSALASPIPGSLSARPLTDNGRFRIGRQGDGSAALLIATDEHGHTRPPTGDQLAHLTYDPRKRLRIESPDGQIEESVHTVVACRSPDQELRHYFFRVSSALLDELGTDPSVHEVDRCVGQLLELFRALQRPGRRSVQGVWAELLLMAHSSNPSLAVAAWHAEPEAMHDFVAGRCRVEVKSTIGEIRQHHFRLEQLHAPEGSELIVASLVVTRADDGPTIASLVDRISAALPGRAELRSRLESIVGACLGGDWRVISSAGFSEHAALQSLRFFRASDVPTVALDVPVEVSDVHFRVDLSGVEATSAVLLRREGALFDALVSAADLELA